MSVCLLIKREHVHTYSIKVFQKQRSAVLFSANAPSGHVEKLKVDSASLTFRVGKIKRRTVLALGVLFFFVNRLL